MWERRERNFYCDVDEESEHWALGCELRDEYSNVSNEASTSRCDIALHVAAADNSYPAGYNNSPRLHQPTRSLYPPDP